jgi:hypothetical protein
VNDFHRQIMFEYGINEFPKCSKAVFFRGADLWCAPKFMFIRNPIYSSKNQSFVFNGIFPLSMSLDWSCRNETMLLITELPTINMS